MQALLDAGVITQPRDGVRLLAKGELTAKVTLQGGRRLGRCQGRCRSRRRHLSNCRRPSRRR